jgi:glycosyltransferase involved in cell wall biosynthesis
MALAALAAARLRDVRSVTLVSQLPPALLGGPGKPGWSWRRLLRLGLEATHAAVFHNSEAARRLAELGLLPDGLDVRLVDGGGVDLAHFSAEPLPPIDDGPTFVMIAALAESKGVREFCAAAAQVRAMAPAARFILVGPDAAGPGAIDRIALAAAAGATVDIVAEQADIRPWLARAHAFVLPSHAEGLSRTLLEALATGRPVIASNIPGCREAVDERINGVLVPPGDAGALAAAMLGLLRRSEQLPIMARASRLKAERRFDARVVNRELMAVMGLD